MTTFSSSEIVFDFTTLSTFSFTALGLFTFSSTFFAFGYVFGITNSSPHKEPANVSPPKGNTPAYAGAIYQEE